MMNPAGVAKLLLIWDTLEPYKIVYEASTPLPEWAVDDVLLRLAESPVVVVSAEVKGDIPKGSLDFTNEVWVHCDNRVLRIMQGKAWGIKIGIVTKWSQHYCFQTPCCQTLEKPSLIGVRLN